MGNDSQDEEDVKEEENSDSVETAEADENESEDEEKKENSNIIKVDKFFEIDSYVENENSDSENSEEETTEAETEAAKAIGIMAHSDKNAIAQTAEDAEAEVDADAETDAEIEAETETKAAKAIGILAHSEKTATAQTEETTEAAEEEKDYDVIDLSEYVTVSSAVKKFHEEWIESESFDSGNKIGLTLYFSIPEDVMYDKDTRVAAYSMPEGLTSQFEGKGKVISGDETVGTYKLKKNEIEITFDTAFVKSGKSIEGALFFKGRVENNTDEDCLTIELGGTAGSLDVYKEIKKEVVSEDGKVLVTATFGASTFDGDVTLYADSLDEETKNNIINAYNEKLSEENREVANLYLYDVYFMDEEGTKIEPDGHVSVKMSFTEPVESKDDEEIKVLHVRDNDPSDIEDLTSMDDTVIKENSKGEIKDLELVADSFSPYGFVTLQEDHFDLKDFLSGMSITGAEETDTGWKVKNKEAYTLYLTFSEVSESRDIQFPDDDTWMYYKIPEGLYIEEKESTFDVIIDGKYTISENIIYVEKETRRLYFQWNIKDADIEHLRSATDLKITAELTGMFYQDGLELYFQNDAKKTIKIDYSHDISISKYGYFNTDDKLLHYTLTVTSTGVCEDVLVTDTLSGSNIELATEKAITVKNKSTGKVIDNAKININNDKKGFTVSIDEMKNGEEIEITYRARLTSLPEDAKLTFDTVGNTAKVNVDKIEKEVKYDISKNLSELKKIAGTIGDTYRDEATPYGFIDYEINVNKERSVDITYIKDTISESNRSYTSFYGDGIEVYVNDSTTPIKIKWDDLQQEKDSSGKAYGWRWNVPNDIAKNSSFRITYQTKVYRSYDEYRYIINSVETNHHESVEAGTSVNVLSHKKDVSKEVLSYDNEGVIWKLSFKVPADGLDMALIKDDLPHYYNEFSDTLDSDYPEVDSKYPVKVEGLVGNETFVVKNPYIRKEGENVYRFKIAFFKDKNKSLEFPSDQYADRKENDGLTGTGKERTITITYRTKNNQKWIEKTATNLNIQALKEHVNEAYFFIHNWMEQKNASVILVTGRLIKKSSYPVELDSEAKKDHILLIGYDLVFSIPADHTGGITFVDTYDNRLSFVDSEEENKKHTWYYDIPYKITDSGKLFYSNTNMDWPENDSGKTVTLNNPPGTNTITIKVDSDSIPKDANGKYYQSYRIRYYLQIDISKVRELAIQNNGKVTFDNTIKWGENLSSKCSVDYSYETLKKEGWYEANEGLAKYKITVNPSGLTLNNGKPLTLTDVYSDNQIIDISDIVVKEVGHDEPLTNIKYHMEDMEGHRKLIFENLPDSKKLTITYSALPLLTSGSATLENTASLLWTDYTVNPTAYFNAKAAGTGSTLGIKIIKHKSGDESTKLNDAEFKLYKVADNGDKVPIEYAEGGTVTFVTGKNAAGEAFTGKDAEKYKGVAEVSLNTIKTKNNEKFNRGQLYCLVESKAPDGYRVNDNNVYYFRFAPQGSSDFKYDPEDPIYPNNYILTIANDEIAWYALPDTGSMGVNPLYLIGTVLVALGGIFLILRRRNEYLL